MGHRDRSSATAEHAGHRHARLEALLRDEIASLLADEVDDPALFGVTVAHVVLSVDYRHAKVYFDVAADASGRRDEVERALVRATGFVRARLADAVDLKRVPELRFVHYV